jgi:hypothetical protein
MTKSVLSILVGIANGLSLHPWTALASRSGFIRGLADRRAELLLTQLIRRNRALCGDAWDKPIDQLCWIMFLGIRQWTDAS